MTKTEEFEIEIEGGRIINAYVEINANYYSETQWTSASCDYTWVCHELTETLEDGTIIQLNPNDYESWIEERVCNEI